MTLCPHCDSNIIPMAGGICPSCQKNINDIELIKFSKITREIWSRVDEMMLAGTGINKAFEKIKSGNYDAKAIEIVEKEYRNRMDEYRFGIKKSLILPGIIAVMIGSLVTLSSFIMGEKIGFFLIWYGIIFYGLLSIALGSVKLLKAR